MAYAGYLLSVGGTNVPMTYMQVESYKVTPNQRLDLSAERNANGVLVRSVVSHRPSKIDFTTPYMLEADMTALMGIFNGALTSVAERKLSATYFCPDTGGYQTGRFYVPDIDFVIFSAAGGKLKYAPTRIALIEY